MADSYSPVFHVKNFSANNNLRFKYTVPSTSRVSSHYSKALSIIPYTSPVDTTPSSLKSPLSPSSALSSSGILSMSRHYTSPLPSLSVATPESYLSRSSLISPGSARSVRYNRSSSAAIGGTSSLDYQRYSSTSYGLLSGGAGSSSHSPTSAAASALSPTSTSTTSQRSPLSMFPIVSKSLLRYRHTFSRPSSLIARRCGSVDPDIYRRISVSRQMPSYSSISSSTAASIEIRASSRSRSQSASCSNSRSSSMDRYVKRNAGSGGCSGGDSLLLGSSTSGGVRNKDSRTGFSRESSYSAVSSSGNGFDNDENNHPGPENSYRATSSRKNSVSGAATAEGKTYPSCVSELARNVASHQWDSVENHENGDDDVTGNNGAGANRHISSGGGGGNDNDYSEVSTMNGNDDGNHDSGIQGKSSTVSRQSSVTSTCISAGTDFDSCSTTTVIPPPPPLPPLESNGGYESNSNGAGNYNRVHNGSASLSSSDLIIPAPRLHNHHRNDYDYSSPSITRTKVAQSTVTATDQRITTTTTSTDIIDMKFVNGFAHLTSNGNGTSMGSLDRISSPSKSTRQRIRLAKLQNKYGVFKSWLTPEDEQTLARAEARLAARRQARAEARDIRMKELEKQQKEIDDNADRHYDMHSTGSSGGGGGGGDVVNRAAFRVALGSHRGPSHSVGSASYHSSRRSSEDSSEDGMVSIRDMRHELKELEDKFRKSMVQNAQLDNEKSALTYQVELLKDRIEDLEESLTLLQREYRDKSRDFENLKRLSTQLKDELEYCKAQLLEKEELIKEYGLVVVENEVEVDLGNGEKETRIKRSLVTQETAQVLSTLGSGSLDVRLKKFLEEKNDLLDQIRRLTIDLEEERNKHSKNDRGGAHNNASNSSAYTNGPDEDSIDAQKDASKQLADYRFKTQKYEQEIATLQANVTRLDGQVTRFKTAAEEAESREDDLKVEKRKLQRELREAQSKLDELETTNSHLQKRLDKLKTAKSTLLKEL